MLVHFLLNFEFLTIIGNLNFNFYNCLHLKYHFKCLTINLLLSIHYFNYFINIIIIHFLKFIFIH